jgi:hypothetical protein
MLPSRRSKEAVALDLVPVAYWPDTQVGVVMAKPVPKEVVEAIYEHGRLGREAWQRGALADAEREFLTAWDCLPEPRLDHDYAQSMSRGLVVFYRDTAQVGKAKWWLEVMRGTYGAEPNDSVEFLAGTVHHEAGEFEQAFALFDGVFRRFGQRPFEGKDKKYLAFYKKRASAG